MSARVHPSRLLLLVVGLVAFGCAATPRDAPDAASAEPADGTPSLEALGGADDWSPPPAAELLPAELTTVGWDSFSGSPVVLLRTLDAGQVVPIWIGIAEAQAIARALHGLAMPRPMTHDLMADLLRTLDAGLEEVLITELRDGVYYGRLKVRLDGAAQPRWIDTRPSDGLALALRTGAVIRLAQKIVDDLPDYDFLAPETPEQVVRTLGLTVVSPDEELRREFVFGDRTGVVVIAASGQAAAQGMRRGDLIVALDGEPVSAPVDLLEKLRDRPESITLTYWRDGEEHEAVLYPLEPEATVVA